MPSETESALLAYLRQIPKLGAAADLHLGVRLATRDAVEHRRHAVFAFGEFGRAFPTEVLHVGVVAEVLPAARRQVAHHVHVIGRAAVLGDRRWNLLEGDPGVRPRIRRGMAKGFGDRLWQLDRFGFALDHGEHAREVAVR